MMQEDKQDHHPPLSDKAGVILEAVGRWLSNLPGPLRSATRDRAMRCTEEMLRRLNEAQMRSLFNMWTDRFAERDPRSWWTIARECFVSRSGDLRFGALTIALAGEQNNWHTRIFFNSAFMADYSFWDFKSRLGGNPVLDAEEIELVWLARRGTGSTVQLSPAASLRLRELIDACDSSVPNPIQLVTFAGREPIEQSFHAIATSRFCTGAFVRAEPAVVIEVAPRCPTYPRTISFAVYPFPGGMHRDETAARLRYGKALPDRIDERAGTTISMCAAAMVSLSEQEPWIEFGLDIHDVISARLFVRSLLAAGPLQTCNPFVIRSPSSEPGMITQLLWHLLPPLAMAAPYCPVVRFEGMNLNDTVTERRKIETLCERLSLARKREIEERWAVVSNILSTRKLPMHFHSLQSRIRDGLWCRLPEAFTVEFKG